MRLTRTLFRRVSVALCLLGTALSAHAQKLSPGLWENTITLKGDARMDAAMARMQEQLAKMTPEQRQQMEAMMAGRGIGIGGPGGAPNTVRVCISQEQAERQELPQAGEGRCKRESMERSGNTIKFKLTCTDPAGTGEGSFTFTSDKAYTGSMVMDVTRNGRATHVEMQQSGQWLSADCGGLQPRR